MACSSGAFHTIALSDDGVVHTFGNNELGQLGLGHNNDVSLPTPIPNLPLIKQISCGSHFTVCVDDEGFLWTFGKNSFGSVETGNKTNSNVPHKIFNIPPVLSVACGSEHTLIITNDDDLWSRGKNNHGQLCLGNKTNQSEFQKTSFFNISRISAGNQHSLFQNNKGEIFSCGFNYAGECALGHFQHPQITPTLITGIHSNIVNFVCGTHHNLFLDSEGNVFSVGYNIFGQLGLSHFKEENVLRQITNIPPIQTISCISNSSYLVDIEGNVWSFGFNFNGQLGHGDKTQRNVPTKIESLKNIQQISYGSNGVGFYSKDSQNRIFETRGVEMDKIQSNLIPQEMDPEYFSIWGDSIKIKSRAKSA